MSKKMLFLTLAASLAALTSSASGALVAHWPLNNSPNDQVGTLNWTLNNGATYSSNCREGTASLLCDGVDDYASVGSSGALGSAFSTKTVALWFKPNATTGTQVIFDEGGVTKGLAIRIYNGALEAAVRAATVQFTVSTPFSRTSWSHVAVSFDNGVLKLYLNGKEVDSVTASFTSVDSHSNASGLGARNGEDSFGSSGTGDYYGGLIDDVQSYDQVLTPAEIRALGGVVNLAGSPNPADGAGDVPRDMLLSWTAGEYAGTHDVYLGTVFSDVNTASRTNPRGLLVSQGQTVTAYEPGRLAFGTTYYWRVDEVNAPPSSTVFPGETWSFTTEPLAYPVDGRTITVTASSAQGGQGPENTVNGSGLTADLHASDTSTMWLTAQGAAGPAWIQYQFDRLIQLHEMWVWNHNTLLEAALGFGAKDVTIEYSADGIHFQTLGTTYQFARASGRPDYTHNTTVAFGDIAVKAVKLTIRNNWGGLLPQYGLSEVRFLAVPVYARQPSPASGTTALAPQVALRWRAGREAGSHQVLLGTDPNHLALAATVQKATYTVDLNLNQMYYWKIVEVNQAKDPASWAGDVWSLSTVASLVVDDFESYTDADGKAVWQTWIDGYGTTTNGAQVGNANPPYAEKTIIHGGKQAMPLFYNNTAGATYSEATRTFDSPQDWTKYGIKALTLYFLGDPNNTGGTLYVKINNTKVLYDGAATAIQSKPWQMWYIDLTSLAGANLKQVTRLTIGLDGGKGVLYVDDIALSPRSRELVTPVQPAATNLLVRYAFEGNLKDSAGTQNLTATGAPQYTAGHLGQALLLNGTSDFVSVTPTSLALPVYTASMWFRVDGGTGNRDILSLYNSAGGFGISGEIGGNGTFRFLHRFPFGSSGGTNIYSTFSCADGKWYHAALVKTADTMMLYINGLPAGTATDTTQFDTPLAALAIGVLKHDSLSRYFPGAIDEVYLYNRVLSDAEIAGLAGRTAPFVQPF